MACGSLRFDDEYFSQRVYQDQATSAQPDLLSLYRRGVPQGPTVHAPGSVGPSSRWWYLPGMYAPRVGKCPCCRGEESEGRKAIRCMAESADRRVQHTRDLYRVPLVEASGREASICITWPRYVEGEFEHQGQRQGPSMLELTEAERQALVIVVLRTEVRAEKYGAPHALN